MKLLIVNKDCLLSNIYYIHDNHQNHIQQVIMFINVFIKVNILQLTIIV